MTASDPAAPATRAEGFLPDLCSREAVFAVLLIMQLVALLLLARDAGDRLLWDRLLVVSLYLHWIGLCSAAVLCLTRRPLAGLGLRAAMLASFALLLLVTAVISEAAWQLAHWLEQPQLLPDRQHGVFLLRNLLVCTIVSALALRYFWLLAQWRGQVRAEGEARFQALQARIRPHFLFNSLNSIAALITSRPQAAETAVEDLAQLFRAGLSSRDRQVALREEIDITRAYLRTESLRLGARLQVAWQVEAGLDDVPVPLLCLQPLVENAVTHGIEPLPGGGEIRVGIRREGARLCIEVDNPVPASPMPSSGARSALDNIRQRLALIYGERAALAIEAAPAGFRVSLQLPLAPD